MSSFFSFLKNKSLFEELFIMGYFSKRSKKEIQLRYIFGKAKARVFTTRIIDLIPVKLPGHSTTTILSISS